MNANDHATILPTVTSREYCSIASRALTKIWRLPKANIFQRMLYVLYSSLNFDANVYFFFFHFFFFIFLRLKKAIFFYINYWCLNLRDQTCGLKKKNPLSTGCLSFVSALRFRIQGTVYYTLFSLPVQQKNNSHDFEINVKSKTCSSATTA